MGFTEPTHYDSLVVGGRFIVELPLPPNWVAGVARMNLANAPAIEQDPDIPVFHLVEEKHIGPFAELPRALLDKS